MKSNKEFRGKTSNFNSEDSARKAMKLEPIKKSGKDRHALYGELEEEDDPELLNYKKKESVLDYFDDSDDLEEEYSM